MITPSRTFIIGSLVSLIFFSSVQAVKPIIPQRLSEKDLQEILNKIEHKTVKSRAWEDKLYNRWREKCALTTLFSAAGMAGAYLWRNLCEEYVGARVLGMAVFGLGGLFQAYRTYTGIEEEGEHQDRCESQMQQAATLTKQGHVKDVQSMQDELVVIVLKQQCRTDTTSPEKRMQLQAYKMGIKHPNIMPEDREKEAKQIVRKILRDLKSTSASSS